MKGDFNINFLHTPSITWPVGWESFTTTSNDLNVPTSWINLNPTATVAPVEKEANLRFQVASIDILDEGRMNQAAFAKAGLERQPDLLYVRFKLMHEGGNKNLDFFDKEELKAAAGTPVLKHLNWEHGEPTIGMIYFAEFVDPLEESGSAKGNSSERAHIIAEAAVWKFRYPDIAKKMVKRHASKTLAFSMEAYYTEAECSMCGKIFAAEDHPEGTYCEHLNKRFDTAETSTDEPTYRKLRGFILGGAGVVEDPADVDAEALALAQRSKEVRSLDKIELTQTELDAKIAEAVKDALAEAAKNADVTDLTERADAAEADAKEKGEALTEATATIEKLTAERDEAQASLKENEDKATKAAKTAERQTALDEAGYVASEDEAEAEAAMAKFVSMSDDVFELFTTTVKAGVNKEEPKGKPAGNSQASARVPVAGGTTKAAAKSNTKEAADILARL